jgi:dolichol kinase
MSGAVFPFYILYVGWTISVVTFSFLLLAGFLIAEGYKRRISIPLVTELINTSERPEMIEKNPAKGALRFFIGALICLIIFKYNINIACASIMILALGDSFSTLVGKNFGKRKIFYNPAKSWEGSVAGFIFAFLGATTQIALFLAFVGALVGMLIESLPAKIDDNITIPISSGLVMSLMLYLA